MATVDRHSRTPEEVLVWLHETGTPVSAWARAHGFEPSVVYALLTGRTRGNRGMSHQAAVALGLKRGVATDAGAQLPTMDAP